MASTNKRTTIYFDSALHRALRVKAAETDQSVSDLVNEAVRYSLAEDAEDLAAFEERARNPTCLSKTSSRNSSAVAKFRVLIKPSAKKELESIAGKKDRQRIVRRIQGLAGDPRPPGCRKLSGYDRYRVRQGRYRIVYEIRDDALVVAVMRIGHQHDVYRGF